jgi:hypothetical protein
MPLKTELLRDNRVLLLTYSDPLTTTDVISGLDTFKSVYATATRPLHSISDASQVTRMPPNLLSLITHTKDTPLRHPMAGLFVIVTKSSFVSALASATARLIPGIKIRAVGTLELAWAEIDSALASENDSAPSLNP